MAAAASSACLGGLADAAWTPFSTGLNWDSRSFTEALFLTGRGNTVSQAFSRRFASIDYKVQRQSLHREDVRDLVDLTTSRMDIYNLVGTLLLTFCITWFTDSAIFGSDLPSWYEDLFLVSNFSAVGYLTMSVWMAMYAAVCSRAIGTRLLTSYNRLALPVQEDLDEIKVPIFFPSHKVSSFFGRCFCKASSEARDELKGIDRYRKSDGEVSSNDDLQHFRRFLHELPRWLNHDTYARVCMSMGMNQMLLALAYNILGTVWTQSPVSASMCLAAAIGLSLVVMKLDFGQGDDWEKSDLAAVVLFYALPPVLSIFALWSPLLHGNAETFNGDGVKGDSLYGTLFSVPVFLLHAAWFRYIAHELNHVEDKHARFKPGQFANVLEWVDHKSACQDVVCEIVSSCQTLRQRMHDQRDLEETLRITSVSQRQSDELQVLAHGIVDACARLENDSSHPQIKELVAYADQLINTFLVWAKAPQVNAIFIALRMTAVQAKLTEAQRMAIENSYKRFRLTCRKLKLGFFCDGDALRIEPADLPAVRMEVADDAQVLLAEHADLASDIEEQPMYEWILPNGEVSGKEPSNQTVISVIDVVDKLLPHWEEFTAQVIELGTAEDGGVGPPPMMELEHVSSEGKDSSGMPSLKAVSGKQGVADRMTVCGGAEPGRWTCHENVELRASTTNLPYRSVWGFTMVTMVWYLVAALTRAGMKAFHIHFGGMQYVHWKALTLIEDPPEKTSFIGWPEPRRLFKIETLQCNGSQVWVSSKFAAYSASHAGNTSVCSLIGMDYGAMTAVICGYELCHSLRPSADRAHWFLESFEPCEHDAETLPVPSTWRLLTGAWSCGSPHSKAPCGEATLAGWDGSAIVVARLYRDASSGNWSIRPKFELDPIMGFGNKDDWMSCAHWAGSPCRDTAKYDDVNAIQLGTNGRTITVLLGDGMLHAWDLSNGKVIGRWRPHNVYTSMCHSDSRVFMARQTDAGPVVDSVPLPPALAEVIVPAHTQA